MTADDLLNAIRRQFAIPVLRMKHAEDLFETSRALARGGLEIVEVTLMSDAAHDAIRALALDRRVVVGAGTVRTVIQAEKAIEDGAEFIVSPGFSMDIAQVCSEAEIFHVPGAMTPSEVMAASRAGFSMIKIFPAAAVGGPVYLKHLAGPFPDLEWMATGGIGLGDLAAYKKAGASAVGLGSQLLPQGAVEGARWLEVEASARTVHDAIKKF